MKLLRRPRTGAIATDTGCGLDENAYIVAAIMIVGAMADFTVHDFTFTEEDLDLHSREPVKPRLDTHAVRREVLDRATASLSDDAIEH